MPAHDTFALLRGGIPRPTAHARSARIDFADRPALVYPRAGEHDGGFGKGMTRCERAVSSAIDELRR